MNENYINHMVLVIDASQSMDHLAQEVVKVADEQIAYLAQRSKDLDQETRVSVYFFSNTVRCIIYDKDVLRLPSIARYYRPDGMTALVDATLKAHDDLAKTPELYGDHAFLIYVITDGQENYSRAKPELLKITIDKLRDNWTLAVLVPNQQGKFEAKKFGFPPDNIAIWDATTKLGVVEAGKTIRQATDQFMTNRNLGIRSTRSLFSTDASAVNKTTIKAANLKSMKRSSYKLITVDFESQIRDFVQAKGFTYQKGMAYYQLTKTESIQPQKNIAIVEKSSGKVFMGPQARDMLGLPDMEVRVKPDYNPDFDVFVQSTSFNRKLVHNTKLLLVL